MDWGFLLGGASGRRIPATRGGSGAHGGRAALEETNGDRRSASGRSAGNRTTEGGDDSASTAGRRGSSRRLCFVWRFWPWGLAAVVVFVVFSFLFLFYD